MTPAWILDVFAAVVLTVAALSVARIAAVWPWRRRAAVAEADIAYLLIGIAMAGTLAASLRTLPDGAWEVIFGVLTAWLARQAVRDARASGARGLAGLPDAPQRVHSAAMLYMFFALAAPAASGGTEASGAAMPTLNLPTLAFVFAFVLAGYTAWDLDRLSGVRYSLVLADATAAGGLSPASVVSVPDRDDRQEDRDGRQGNTVGAVRGFLLAPGMTVGCRVAMSVTMVFMLLIMI
ncbi:MAG: DUF5134 domain-containing protein [Trebonia sp.]